MSIKMLKDNTKKIKQIISYAKSLEEKNAGLKAELGVTRQLLTVENKSVTRWQNNYRDLRKAIKKAFEVAEIDYTSCIIPCAAPCARDLEDAFKILKKALEGKSEEGKPEGKA